MLTFESKYYKDSIIIINNTDKHFDGLRATHSERNKAFAENKFSGLINSPGGKNKVTEDDKGVKTCDTGDGRSVFIAPKSGSWGASGALTITVSGGPIKSASGRLSPASTYTVNAELSGKNVDAKYHGIAAADVVLSTDPVCKPAPAADMSMAPADMATPNG